MAYDKVIDSAALDAGLTATAEAIREKTGQTEPIPWEAEKGFSDAVKGILAGAGSGGGLAYDMGEFVLDADTQYIDTADSAILHDLGETPEFVLVWTDDFSDLTADNPSPYTTATSLGFVWLDGLIGLTQRLTSAANTEYALQAIISLPANGYLASMSPPTSPAYGIGAGSVPTDQKIGLPKLANNCFWRAGVTYRYFVSKAWWNVGGVTDAE